jgi:hypothetical protein
VVGAEGEEDQTKSNRGRSSDSNRTEERRPSSYIHLLYGSTCPRLRRIPLRLTRVRVAHLEWVPALMELHYYPLVIVMGNCSAKKVSGNSILILGAYAL